MKYGGNVARRVVLCANQNYVNAFNYNCCKHVSRSCHAWPAVPDTVNLTPRYLVFLLVAFHISGKRFGKFSINYMGSSDTSRAE